MFTVGLLRTEELDVHALQEVRELVVEAFVGDFGADDWEHALGGWHVLIRDERRIVAHAAVVVRELFVDERAVRVGYVEGVATRPLLQGVGLGTLAMTHASSLVRESVEMGALSTGRHDFYERLGWERWQGPTFVRIDGQSVRTPEDDDGVMVLRFGPSRGVPLTAALSCAHRAGDVW